MSIHDDLYRAHAAVRDLQSAVLGLRAHLGTHIDVLRLADDVARCAADLGRLEEQTSPARRVPEHEFVVIPDGEYDESLWADGDVDAEGLGVPGRRAP
ncbi:MAG TPA: hypothetical protein VFJ14_16495 [Nocardioidaceae bacterium]|nr:hypothetical protein [Nocardioidaceae bacterium]